MAERLPQTIKYSASKTYSIRIEHLFPVDCLEMTKNKETCPGLAHFKGAIH